MQLGSKEDESERFSHYMTKTFKKTASLIANSCKSVSSFAWSLVTEVIRDYIPCWFVFAMNCTVQNVPFKRFKNINCGPDL